MTMKYELIVGVLLIFVGVCNECCGGPANCSATQTTGSGQLITYAAIAPVSGSMLEIDSGYGYEINYTSWMVFYYQEEEMEDEWEECGVGKGVYNGSLTLTTGWNVSGSFGFSTPAGASAALEITPPSSATGQMPTFSLVGPTLYTQYRFGVRVLYCELQYSGTHYVLNPTTGSVQDGWPTTLSVQKYQHKGPDRCIEWQCCDYTD